MGRKEGGITYAGWGGNHNAQLQLQLPTKGRSMLRIDASNRSLNRSEGYNKYKYRDCIWADIRVRVFFQVQVMLSLDFLCPAKAPPPPCFRIVLYVV